MIRIGISGWTYAPWRGAFFPQGLPQRAELAYASRRVNSIEINGTFYSLQTPASYQRWADAVPTDFIFAVKAPRYITHIKRLKGGPGLIANFFASGVLRLEAKLGPILWQLPPSLRYDYAVMDRFLASLPRNTTAAAALAREHDDKVRTPWTQTLHRAPLRHALEVRHPSFENPEFIAQLRHHQVALVVADTAGKWPWMEDVTADFIYVRLHGDAELYVSGYTPRALADWARKIRAWSKGKIPARSKLVAPDQKPTPRQLREVFVYFDNDVKTRAPFDAMSLAHELKLGPKPDREPSVSSISEQPRTHWPGFPRRS